MSKLLLRRVLGFKLAIIGMVMAILPFLLVFLFHDPDEGAPIAPPVLGFFGLLLVPLGLIMAFTGLVLVLIQKFKKD